MGNWSAKNILSAHAGIDTWKLRRMDLDEAEIENIKKSVKCMENAPLIVDDSSALTVPQLRAKCRRIAQRRKLKLVVIDYLQLMRSVGKKMSREQEVAEISGGLKALARDMSIPIIVISQLNRSAEKRDQDDRRPQLSDFRDSGAIEQDADVAFGLYRPEYYDPEANAEHTNICEVGILKNRNGAVGSVKMTFIKNILRFENYVPEQPQTQPRNPMRPWE